MRHCLLDAIKSHSGSPIHAVLKDNIDKIYIALLSSFQNGIFCRRFEFELEIDLISLHDEHGKFDSDCFCTKLLTDLNSMEILLLKFFNFLSRQALLCMNYTNVDVIDIPMNLDFHENNNMYIMNIKFLSFPFLNFYPATTPSKKSIISTNILIFYDKNIEKYSTIIKRPLVNKKYLVNICGTISLTGKKKEFCDIFFKCPNKCPNRTFIISFISKIYKYCENDKFIREIPHLPEVCCTCKTKLSIMFQNVYYEYKYVFTYMNKQITAISKKKFCSEENKNPKDVVITGYAHVNQRGFKSLNLLSFCENYKQKVLISPEIKSNKKLDGYLKDYSKSIIHSNIGCNEQSLLIILNIFSVIFKSLKISSIRPSSIASSPISSENDIKVHPTDYTDNFTILIFTNDIAFVRHVAKNVFSMCNSRTKIIYKMKNVIRGGYNLCIKEINDSSEQKYNKDADLKFILHIKNTFNYEYFKGSEFTYHHIVDSIPCENLTSQTQELFLEFRKIFKGIIEPTKLLKCTGLLMKSVNDISMGMFSAKEIRILLWKHFSSIIL